jgi:hypothetical protein
MKIINGKTKGLVLMREEEYQRLFKKDGEGPGPDCPRTVDGIVILDWDTFEASTWGLSLGQLSQFFEKQVGYRPTAHNDFGAKIRTPDEVREWITDHLFTELEESI